MDSPIKTASKAQHEAAIAESHAVAEAGGRYVAAYRAGSHPRAALGRGAAMSDLSETRKGIVVAAARSLREDRVAGGIALLTSAGYGLMLSKAGLEADGSIEATVMDLVGEQREVGTGTGKHVGGALLKALGPLLEQAGKRPKLKGITGGRAIDKHRKPLPVEVPVTIFTAPFGEPLPEHVPLSEALDAPALDVGEHAGCVHENVLTIGPDGRCEACGKRGPFA